MATKNPSVDPQTEDFFKGPSIGDALPAFELPDQRSNLVRYDPDCSGKALVLFHRSADW
jgi:hypothetical protein